jgi:hypothetical protein
MAPQDYHRKLFNYLRYIQSSDYNCIYIPYKNPLKGVLYIIYNNILHNYIRSILMFEVFVPVFLALIVFEIVREAYNRFADWFFVSRYDEDY